MIACTSFIMLQSFLHSIHVITVIVLSKFQVSITDKPKWSNTSKDNHFHNVPIYYWDWVPIIDNSKQTKDDEFSKIEAASKFFRYHDPNPETISTYKREDRSYDPPHRPRKHINQSAQKKHGCHTVSFRVCTLYNCNNFCSLWFCELTQNL